MKEKAGCDKEEAASDRGRSSFVPTLLVCVKEGVRCRARAGSCRAKVKGVEGRNRVALNRWTIVTLSDPCG